MAHMNPISLEFLLDLGGFVLIHTRNWWASILHGNSLLLELFVK